MKHQSIVVVDAFADRPFVGNPAAVCVLDAAAPENWMRSVAREMNLSETAFLHPEAGAWRLRWLTPTVEIDLCGHATLASAHVLWETGRLPPQATARFRTRSGLLSAAREGDWIVLDFPSTPPQPCAAPPGLAQAVGVEPRWVGLTRFDYFVEVADEEHVRRAMPDPRALGLLAVRGVIVTAASSGTPYDFVSRFFEPGSGVLEDPVTGSAHCALGPFWSARLGKTELHAYQASARGGEVRVRVRADRVYLGGHAVTVTRAEILGY